MDSNDNESKTTNHKRKQSLYTNGKKRKKLMKKELNAEDLSILNDAEPQSNLFKLQVNDFLKELKQTKEESELWLNSFKEFVMNIPESSPAALKDFSLGKEVQVPISNIPESDKGLFKFIPPSQVLEIGSYVFDTVCSSTPVIDIAVEIPKSCWQNMDHLNYRYHRKRAMYLMYIAHSLIDTDLTSHMEFSCQNEIESKPNLLIVPKESKAFSFCLTAFPCEEVFKESRFSPEKNNIRASWLTGRADAVDEATPFYNNTVWSDLLLVKLNSHIKEILSSFSLKEAIILLKTWLLRRDLTVGFGRISGFAVTAYVVSLLSKRRISTHMSTCEIFKSILLDLSTELLTGNFFHEFSEFNALYFVSNETLLMIQHEAKIALSILNEMSPNTFYNLFERKITFCEKFEYLMHLKGLKLENVPKICEKLKEGLKDRIQLLDVLKKPCLSWPLSLSPPSIDENLITIGFLLNPNVPLNNLEKGPVANDPEAKKFQEFWGTQSELRRFQDGSVREAVLWPAKTIADKREVFCTILKDIMERHIKIDRNEVEINGVETDCVLHIPEIIYPEDFPPYGTGEEAHVKIMQSFNSLSKELRNLKLPLLVSSVQGISSSFRFSEVFPPVSVLREVDPAKCVVDGHQIMKLKSKSIGVPPYIPALKAIVHFEGSGKWPDDVEALKRVKAAFQVKIADLMKTECSLKAVPFVTHTDVFKDGYVFRLEVACHKEIYLLKQTKSADGSLKIKETKESRELEIHTETLPMLNSVLHGLHQQHNSYGTACRLAKRWIASQLKHGFIHDITIELLVAFLYVHPAPFSSPSLPQVAFIRFLSLLTTHNWAANPLIINFNNEFKSSDIEEMNIAFTSQRTTLPAMVVITPFDKRGNTWTKNMPHQLMLKRIILLAEASLETLSEHFSSFNFFDIKSIFRPPLEAYDVFIYLKRRELSKLSYAIDVRKNDPLPRHVPYEHKSEEPYPIVDFDPVEKYIEELKVNFGDWAIFLNDPYGSDFIAVKWKSAAFIPENAKTYHGCKVIPNVEEIVESFKVLGDGLVSHIECKTKNWQLP